MIKNKLEKDYNLNGINFLDDLTLETGKIEFHQMRDKTILTLLGYYQYSMESISKFVEDLKRQFRIENKNIVTNKEIVNRKENKKEEIKKEENKYEILIKSLSNRDKGILIEFEKKIIKYPANSKERKILMNIREKILEALYKKYSKEGRLYKERERNRNRNRKKNRNRKPKNNRKEEVKKKNEEKNEDEEKENEEEINEEEEEEEN